MNARLREYALLWRAALSLTSSFDSAIVRWGGLFIAIALCAPVWYSRGMDAALVLAWCIASGVLLMTWAWRFIPGAVKLAAPADAKLVPGLRRRLVELACLVWFAAIAAIALVAYADNGTIGMWLLWVMLGTVGSALSSAGHQAGGAMIFAGCMGGVFPGRLSDSVAGHLSHPAAVALVLLACAAAIVVAARAMFPEAGDRHWRMIDRRLRIFPAPGKPDPLLEELAGKQARGWYAVSLRRACARREARQLVLHALGPAHHIGELLLGLGLFAGVLVVLGIFTTWRTGAGVVEGIGWLLACTLLFAPIAAAVRISPLVSAFPAEQALVRLAPAMPGTAGRFNRHLGRALLGLAFKGWAFASAASLLLAALGGADGATLANVAGICCLVLPVLAAPLRDHAAGARPSALVPLLLLAVSIAASVAIGLALRALVGLPALPLAAGVSIAIAAWSITRGLRVMDSAPFAFPAGRMD